MNALRHYATMAVFGFSIGILSFGLIPSASIYGRVFWLSVAVGLVALVARSSLDFARSARP